MREVTGDVGLAQFQRNNCYQCRFADKPQVGTGEPCCQKGGKLNSNGKLCFSRQGDEDFKALVN